MNRINYSIIILCFEWKICKFENVRIFKHKILIMSRKKERNHYDLKEIENIKNAKIVSIAWHHNVLTEMFTITAKISSFIRKSQIFDQPQPKWASLSTANILQVNSAWYNLKSRLGVT